MSHAVGMIEMGLGVPAACNCTSIALQWTPSTSSLNTGDSPINVVTGLPIDMNLKEPVRAPGDPLGYNPDGILSDLYANLRPQQRWYSCANSSWDLNLNWGPFNAAAQATQNFIRGSISGGQSMRINVSVGINMFGGIFALATFEYAVTTLFNSAGVGGDWIWTEQWVVEYEDNCGLDERTLVSDTVVGNDVGVVGPFAYPGIGLASSYSVDRVAGAPTVGSFSCTWPTTTTRSCGASSSGTWTIPYFRPGDYGLTGFVGASGFNDVHPSDIGAVAGLRASSLITSASVYTSS